jgi:transcriptional regulator with XRE-family HTH domain
MAALSERDRESVSLFVDEMKAAREQRKWSQAELAGRAHCSESSIAMVESYQRPPTATLAKALDKGFGTPGTFERLERRLRNLPFPAAFRSFAPYEAEAAALRMFEHSLVPGLLQTPEYARAVLETKPNAASVAEVALRFDALRSEALPKRASRTFMESVAERWKEATPQAGVSPATAATTAVTA